MKKVILLLLATGIGCTMEAQSSSAGKPLVYHVSPVQLAQMRAKAKRNGEKSGGIINHSNTTNRTLRTESEPTTLPFLGSSANVNGVLDATTTAVSANQATNVISMTHRDNESHVTTCGTGAYVSAFSTDGGTTWDTTIITFCKSNQAYGARYPNGVLFNPAGNTNPTAVYNVMAGPYTNGGTTGNGWTSSVYGSVELSGASGTNDYGVYWSNKSPNIQIQNNGDLSFMSSSDDSTVHVMGQGFDTNATGGFIRWRGAVLTTGKFDPIGDTFAWTQTVFQPHIVPDFKNFTTTSPYDSDAAPLDVPATAWSQDGKTGYVIILANLDSTGYNYYSRQPIVYKTTNSGQTWTMMPPFNFRNIPSLTQFLIPSVDSGIKCPVWFTFETNGSNSQGAQDSYDATVDYQGNLHIFSTIVSSYYTNPDTSHTVYYFGSQAGYIYDVYTTTPTGGWNARLIDSMMTVPSHNVAENGGNPDWDSTSGTAGDWVGFGNRLQASRTTDGKHIFCTWEDDYTGFVSYLAFPDVKGQAFDIPENYAGHVHRFTKTLNSYFMCASNIALTSVSGIDTTYTVPCTVSFPQSPGQGNDGSLPLNYFYLGDVTYNDTLISVTSVPSVVAPTGFSISPNYPNPFNNITRFDISLTNQSLVSVDVFNLFGQKVYTIPAQQMTPGNHTMSINGSSLSSGVYLYRVTANGYAVTQKMVVEQ